MHFILGLFIGTVLGMFILSLCRCMANTANCSGFNNFPLEDEGGKKGVESRL